MSKTVSLLRSRSAASHGLAVAPSLPSLRRAAPQNAAAKDAPSRERAARRRAAVRRRGAPGGDRASPGCRGCRRSTTLGASVACAASCSRCCSASGAARSSSTRATPPIAGMRTRAYGFVGAFISGARGRRALRRCSAARSASSRRRAAPSASREVVRSDGTSQRGGSLSTMGLGSLLFFDDYSSILIVGNSLRPLVAAVARRAHARAYIAHVMGVASSLAPLGGRGATAWRRAAIGGAYEQSPRRSRRGGAALRARRADRLLTSCPIPELLPALGLAFLIAARWPARTRRCLDEPRAVHRRRRRRRRDGARGAAEEAEARAVGSERR